MESQYDEYRSRMVKLIRDLQKDLPGHRRLQYIT